MADRTVRVIITGSSAGAVKAFAETAVASDLAGDAIKDSSGKMSKAIDDSTSSSGFSLSNFGSSLTSMVPLWGKVGIAAAVVVAGVVTGAIVLAAKFQDATNKLAASAGISTKAAAAIGAAFLNTGGQTTFSAQKMVEAFTPVAGQLAALNGRALTTGQSLAFMRAAMALAEATGQSLASTTASLATVMQTFGIPLKGAAAATDDLYNVSRITDTPISALASSVDKLKTKLGPLAPSLGDVSSLLVDLNEHGVTGARGLLAVSTGMNTLLGGSKATNAELKTLGINVYNASGQFVGMQSVLAQLSPKLDGMNDQQQAVAEKALFGAAAGRTLNSTLLAGATAYTTAAAAATKHGTATTAANTATSGLSGSMAKVSASLQDAGVKLGQFFLPVLTTVMGWVAKAAQAFAYVLPGALNILSGVFNVVGKVIGTVISIWSTEIGIVINVIKTIVGVVTNVVNAIKGPIGTIAGFFSTAFGAITGIVNGISAGIGTAVKGVIDTVINVINFFIGAIDDAIGGINDALGVIPTFGLGKIQIPKIGKIPVMDSGGIVTTPTLALLAANSRPEAVMPLDMAKMGPAGAGGATTVNIFVTSNDGQAVVNALKRYMYSNGPLPVTVNRARALGS